MNDPFFIPADNNSGTPSRKRKRVEAPKNKKKAATKEKDEDATGMGAVEDMSDPETNDKDANEEIEDPYADETPDEKRIRLAEHYVQKIKEAEKRKRALRGEDEEEDDGYVEDDSVARQLRRDALEQTGRLRRHVAASLQDATIGEDKLRRIKKAHHLSVTCVALSDDGTMAFSGGKDCSVWQYEVATGKRVHRYLGRRTKSKEKGQAVSGHIGIVTCLAVSTDGLYLATGGHDRTIKIWDTRTHALLQTFKGHRNIVSGLAFRRGTHQLFSCSYDTTVKVWNIDDMAYVETLFGHQGPVECIDGGINDIAVSAGQDRVSRFWKIPEETHLMLGGYHTAPIDCISFINDGTFVTGSQDGALAVWSTGQKKPRVVLRQAHGTVLADGEQGIERPRWITAVAALKHGDLIASGSSDGFVRLWQYDTGGKAGKSLALEPLTTIAMPGFINSLSFGAEGNTLVVGVGQEHRLGRWERISEGRNGVVFVTLPIVEGTAQSLAPMSSLISSLASKSTSASTPIPAAMTPIDFPKFTWDQGNGDGIKLF